tara:strand:+ start:4312 stop:5241 length:930 start_codon:yes stop_codon:yes gene_type:complete
MKTEKNKNEIITAANESRLESAHYSEALTAFAVGWKDPENLKSMLEFIAPNVPVGRRFEFKSSANAEAFYSETDDIRSSGSDFKRVEYTGETVYAKTHNKGLTIRVDRDDTTDENWQERYVHLLMQRLYRNEIRRALQALEQSAKTKDVTWDEESNPDGDLRNALVEAADACGIRSNRMLFGANAWDLRANAYDAQETAGAFRAVELDPKSLASKLLVDDIKILRGRYQEPGFNKQALVGPDVYTFFGDNVVTKDEPSNLKRFVTPAEAGYNFRVFTEETSKFIDITVEHYSNIVVTNPLGIQRLKINA